MMQVPRKFHRRGTATEKLHRIRPSKACIDNLSNSIDCYCSVNIVFSATAGYGRGISFTTMDPSSQLTQDHRMDPRKYKKQSKHGYSSS